MIYKCCDSARRAVLLAQTVYNGIDYLEVADGPDGCQTALYLYFLHPLIPGQLTIGNILICGGERITNIQVSSVIEDRRFHLRQLIQNVPTWFASRWLQSTCCQRDPSWRFLTLQAAPRRKHYCAGRLHAASALLRSCLLRDHIFVQSWLSIMVRLQAGDGLPATVLPSAELLPLAKDATQLP